MNFLNTFKNKTICIPLVQRDYVQGGKESVISPFIDSLLDRSKPSDLNYIYGYTEQECFIPVDGQQRLITLWLLYLYVAARAKKITEFSIDLLFMSREYAGDFCERLQRKLPEVLDRCKETDSLNLIIQDEYWFISSWQKNATVRNMLLTLKYIHRKCAGQDDKTLWDYLLSDDSITFAFLDMKENGLDDDIYIKMNGRGRPLSVFENLKSWMDEKILHARMNSNELWLQEWTKKMDNSWTQFFWDNRNRAQNKSEEIDDEQLFCFCNLLILYWMLHKEQLQFHIRNMRTTDYYLYEQLLSLFPQLKETDGTSEIVGNIFDNLQKGDMPSIVWIERLKLLPLEFLEFAYYSLNQLSSKYTVVKDLNLFMGNTTNDVEPIYDLALSESSYGRTLPLLYSILLITEELNAKAWLRTCRNLILNTKIDKENLPYILSGLNTFAEQAKQRNIYELLKSYDKQNNDFLHSFDRNQIKEECKKASMPSAYLNQMEKMENSKFFSGRINCIFRLLEHKEGIENYTLEDFSDCSEILLEIFYAGEGNTGGIRNIYDKPDNRILRRSLMMYPPYFYGMYKNGYWCFCNDMEEWRSFLNDKESQIQSLRLMIINLCLPAIRQPSSLDLPTSIHQCICKAVEKASEGYEEKLKINVAEDKFNLHFIHYVDIWNYMKTSRCKWSDDDTHGFHILLKTSNGNNSGKMELRTYSLYLDYHETSNRKDLVEDRNGWSVDIWDKKDSCMYFQISASKLGREIAIDVFHKCTKEDDYALSIFLRPNNEEETNLHLYINNNISFFNRFLKENINIPVYQDEETGRYVTNKTFSRNEIQLLLHKLLPLLKIYITELDRMGCH